MSMDSTINLLNSSIPAISYDDDDEDEVFMGIPTIKETNGKNSKNVGRQTLVFSPPTRSVSLSRYQHRRQGNDDIIMEKDEELEDVDLDKTDEQIYDLNTSESTLPIIMVTNPSNSSAEISSDNTLEAEADELNENVLNASFVVETDEKVTLNKEENQDIEYVDELSPENDNSKYSSKDKKDQIEFRPDNIDTSFNKFDGGTEVANIELSKPKINNCDVSLERGGAPVKELSFSFSSIREEMLLFEKLGPDYRIKLEAMSLEEKGLLKDEIANLEPKSAEELAAMMRHVIEDDEDYDDQSFLTQPSMDENWAVYDDNDKSLISTMVDNTNNPDIDVTPEILNATDPEIAQCKNETSPNLFLQPNKPPSSCRTPFRPETSPNFMRSTTAFNLKISPRRVESPSVAVTSSSLHRFKRAPPSVDLSKVISPVARYINSSPAPTLIHTVRARTPTARNRQMFDQVVSNCVTSNPPQAAQVPVRSCPLPSVNYKAPKFISEQSVYAEKTKTLPKSLNQHITPIEAKVVRHLGRIKMNSNPIDEYSPKQENGRRPVLREISRESGIMNQTMDISIHEIKSVQGIGKKSVK